jgi:hypothetical protein
MLLFIFYNKVTCSKFMYFLNITAVPHVVCRKSSYGPIVDCKTFKITSVGSRQVTLC